jgi:hypothetical protein
VPGHRLPQPAPCPCAASASWSQVAGQQRESVLDILGGLPEAALRRAVFPSGWTCLGLIHHLAVDDERYWFRGVAAGEPIEFLVDDDSGWLVGPQTAAEEVFRLYREEIASADAIIAATPLEALARRRDPRWDAWGLARAGGDGEPALDHLAHDRGNRAARRAPRHRAGTSRRPHRPR